MSAPPRSSLDAAPRWPIGRVAAANAKRTPDSEKETRASSSLTSTADDPSSLAGDSHLTSAEETNAASCGGETPKRHAGPAPSRSAACSLATCTTVPPEEGPDAGESERTSAPTTNSKSAESSKNARPSPTRTSATSTRRGRRRLARHGRPTHARRGTHAVRGGDASADERERFGAGRAHLGDAVGRRRRRRDDDAPKRHSVLPGANPRPATVTVAPPRTRDAAGYAESTVTRRAYAYANSSAV